MINRGAARLHGWLAWLFAASIVIQVFLAGLAIFGATRDFGLHIDFGYTVVGLLALAVLLSAVIGGLPRRTIGLSLLLLVLYVVQTALPQAKASLPVIAAFHPVNALALLGLGIILARRAGAAHTA